MASSDKKTLKDYLLDGGIRGKYFYRNYGTDEKSKYEVLDIRLIYGTRPKPFSSIPSALVYVRFTEENHEGISLDELLCDREA